LKKAVVANNFQFPRVQKSLSQVHSLFKLAKVCANVGVLGASVLKTAGVQRNSITEEQKRAPLQTAATRAF